MDTEYDKLERTLRDTTVYRNFCIVCNSLNRYCACTGKCPHEYEIKQVHVISSYLL